MLLVQLKMIQRSKKPHDLSHSSVDVVECATILYGLPFAEQIHFDSARPEFVSYEQQPSIFSDVKVLVLHYHPLVDSVRSSGSHAQRLFVDPRDALFLAPDSQSRIQLEPCKVLCFVQEKPHAFAALVRMIEVST